MAKAMGYRRIRMADEVFPTQPEWVHEFLTKYAREIGLPFFAHIRPEFHDDATVRRMAGIGLKETVIGIQSGSEHIRRHIYNRRLSNERISAFATTLRKLRVAFTYHLLNFNPFEREEHLRETFDLLCKLPFGDLVIFRVVCFPNSPMRRMCEAKAPTALAPNIYEWYGDLFAMCLANPSLRRMGEFILTHKLFKGNSHRVISAPLYVRYTLGDHFRANLARIPRFLVEAFRKTCREIYFT